MGCFPTEIALFGLVMAACISVPFVEGGKVVHVGFTDFSHDDQLAADLTNALSTDSLLELTGSDAIEKGRLVCESLEDAATADTLEISLTARETVLADIASFTNIDGAPFTDGKGRNVWTGQVREHADYDGLPRSIAMSWSGCNKENFLVKMIAPAKNGSIDTIVSHPCPEEEDVFLIAKVRHLARDESDIHATQDFDLDIDVDIDNDEDNGRRLEVSANEGEDANPRERNTEPEDANQGDDTRGSESLATTRRLALEVERGVESARLEDPDIDAKDSDIRLLQEYRSASTDQKEAFHGEGFHRLDEDKVVMPGGRVLEAAEKPVVDVMVLYTKNAMMESNSAAAPGRSSAQMETDIVTSYQGANNALADSGVNFAIRVVHMQQVSYEETSSIVDAVYDLKNNANFDIDVHELRDKHGADLVQLVGFYLNTCGVGFTMSNPTSGFAKYGFSVVHANCLSNFSHIHELGHNCGANHDKDNAQSSHAYSYAFRVCSGQKPFRTIMAYSTGCSTAPRVNVFSNPDLRYAGSPQGSEKADNARVLNEAMSTVVNFRESRTPASTPTPKPVTPTPKPTRKPSPTPTPKPATPSSATSIYPEAITHKRMSRKGCFKDDVRDRVMKAGTNMPAVHGVTIGMTRENCMAYCYNHQSNFEYFGLEYGRECFCRNNKTYNRLGELDASKCGMKCAGDNTETCGGAAAIEVFRIKDLDSDANVPLSSPYSYQGCFRDVLPELGSAKAEVLNFRHSSHEVCNENCSLAGYRYFVLEFGFMCSCADSLPHISRQAEDSECNSPCTSPHSDHMCGGMWHEAIFSVDTGT